VLLVRTLDAATAEAVGYVRSFRPGSFHAVTPADAPADIEERWRSFAGAGIDLERLRGGSLTSAIRKYVKGMHAGQNDFVTILVPEIVHGSLVRYLIGRRDLVRLKSSLLHVPHVVVTDAPVVAEHVPAGDAKPLIPHRTVVLVFVSAMNDITIRAVNYARSLDATVTRAIYFDLDPELAHKLETEWFDSALDVPLDIVEAPFRDLTRPMLDEVRRFSRRPDTIVSVVIPEFVVNQWWQLPLHNQNALFIKRLFLYEDRVLLTSVPFELAHHRDEHTHANVG
jgi:hypothetical protein